MISQGIIGRQNIYDTNMNIYAHEILYRNKDGENPLINNMSSELATYKTLYNSIIDVGIENITKGKKLFFNFPEAFFSKGAFPLLPPDIIGIEVLETVPPSKKVISNILFLKENGYTISLDDFEYKNRSYDRMIKQADIVKIDIEGKSSKERSEIVDKIKSTNPNVKLLAERVETNEDLTFCIEQGYELFQGFYFDKPILITGEADTAYTIPKNHKKIFFHASDHPLPLIRKIFKDPQKIQNLIKIANMYSKDYKYKSIFDVLNSFRHQEIISWLHLIENHQKISPQ